MSIELKQINQFELSGFVSSLISQTSTGLFASYLALSTTYVGPNVLYTSGSSQIVSGQKTFIFSPNVPYSGTTGQVVSRQYITDQVNSLGLNGNLNFSGGSVSSYFYVPSPITGSGAINVTYLNTLGIVYNSGNQTINGTKTFTGSVLVPQATTGSQAVPFGQFHDSGINLSNRIGLLEAVTGNGSKSINASFYQRTVYTGFSMGEQFVQASGFFNHLELHSRTNGSTDISGLIYFEDTIGNRIEWTPFILPAFQSFANADPTPTGINGIYRIGYDLSGGYSGMSGLSLGVFGYVFPA